MLNKLEEFKYSAQETLLDEGEMKKPEEQSFVMKEKMSRFDDVIDKLRVQFLMQRRKKKPRRNMKKISFRKKYLEEVENPVDEVTDEILRA